MDHFVVGLSKKNRDGDIDLKIFRLENSVLGHKISAGRKHLLEMEYKPPLQYVLPFPFHTVNWFNLS